MAHVGHENAFGGAGRLCRFHGLPRGLFGQKPLCNITAPAPETGQQALAIDNRHGADLQLDNPAILMPCGEYFFGKGFFSSETLQHKGGKRLALVHIKVVKNKGAAYFIGREPQYLLHRRT